MRSRWLVALFVGMVVASDMLAPRPAAAISGGHPATGQDYGFVRFLRIRWPDGRAGGCTGSLIGERRILTAAHCVLTEDGQPAAGIEVRTRKNAGRANPATATFVHAGYERRVADGDLLFLKNDLAILELRDAASGPYGLTPFDYIAQKQTLPRLQQQHGPDRAGIPAPRRQEPPRRPPVARRIRSPLRRPGRLRPVRMRPTDASLQPDGIEQGQVYREVHLQLQGGSGHRRIVVRSLAVLARGPRPQPDLLGRQGHRNGLAPSQGSRRHLRRPARRQRRPRDRVRQVQATVHHRNDVVRQHVARGQPEPRRSVRLPPRHQGRLGHELQEIRVRALKAGAALRPHRARGAPGAVHVSHAMSSLL